MAEAVNLAPLRQHAAKSNPMGESFDYRKEFLKLDLKAAKEDIRKTLKILSLGGLLTTVTMGRFLLE